MVSQQMQLALLRWPGIYRGLKAVWLRWVTLQGELLLTGEERAEQEQQRADLEQQRAERAELLLSVAQQRIAELEAQLRATSNKEGG